MKTRWKKLAAIAVTCVMASTMAVGLTACGDKVEQPYNIEKRARTGWQDEKVYTRNTATAQLPDVWNEILSSDNANISLASYFNSAFYEYDFQFDSDGNIIPGAYTVQYAAATKLQDVTAKYKGRYGITDEMATEGHHAFAITLRDDLKWDDGTEIKAADFVYTMQQQLSPDYLFTTASNYYAGNYIIHNSKEYLYQGRDVWLDARSTLKEYSEAIDEKIVFTIGSPSENKDFDGNVCNARLAVGIPDAYSAADFAAWLISQGIGSTVENILSLQGKTLKEIKANATLLSVWQALISSWKTEPNEELDFFMTIGSFPELDFSEVGYFVGDNEYELVFVTDSTLSPLDDDGNLTYEAAYYTASFPLVKRDLWEKLADKSSKPHKNAYCSTSVENSASWGPYKLTNYQAGTSYLLERNENWFGYNLERNADKYQTDRIYTRYVPDWNTQWLMFQNGEIDAVGMNISIAQDYRNSSQAYFTPDTATFDINLNSRPESRSSDRNNLLLKYDDFRKAISLSLNRDDYCAKNSPSSQATLGYLNDMYYYDVENSGIYRQSTQAKEAILNAYGAEKTANGWKVGNNEYDDIDDAVDAVTGYNVNLARQLMTSAYEKAKAAGDYADGEKIILTYGIESQTEDEDRVLNWFQNAFNEATKGTPLEGKIELRYFMFSSATWSDQFLNGEYDICFSAWGNAPFNPYYLLGETQIAEENRYALGWDPEQVEVTLSLKGDGTDKCPAIENLTLNLVQWNNSLQGKNGAPYNFKLYPVEDQLTILGAEEAAVLQAYWSIPVFSRYSAALMGYKTDFVTYEYNTFMEYGGIEYMSYNFDDTEWAQFVSDKGGKLNYNFGREG